MKKLKAIVGVLPLLAITGCTSIGADKLVESRFSYTAAIGDSWKAQMLLNVVKLRYGDVPVFLGVQSVIDQTSLTTGLNVNASWSDALSPLAWGTAFGGNAEYVTSPTVTYAPMSGSKFGKQMMAAIPTGSIIGLLQAGYSAEMILRLTVHSINGRDNHFGLDTQSGMVDPSFYRILDLLSALQASNSLGLRVTSVDGKDSITLSLKEPRDADSRIKLAEFRRLLDLDQDTLDFNVVYGVMPSGPKEIAILTRSILDVLADMSANIQVPAKHIAETRVAPAKLVTNAGGRVINPLLTIYSGDCKPEDGFVAVPYHGNWYWINDRDINSKSTFSFLLFIFNLANSGEDDASPDLVLPAGH